MKIAKVRNFPGFDINVRSYVHLSRGGLGKIDISCFGIYDDACILYFARRYGKTWASTLDAVEYGIERQFYPYNKNKGE